MVKKIALGLGVVGIVFAASGVASAATSDTATVTVSANVIGTCRFSTATLSLGFGDLDPASGAAATKSGDLSFWCTNSAPYTLSDPIGNTGTYAGALAGPGVDTIPYTITYTNKSGNGAGKNNPISSTLTASIAAGTYADATAGVYSQDVTFTIAP